MADIRKLKVEDYIQQLVKEELTQKESYLKKQRDRKKRHAEKARKDNFHREK